MEFNSIAMIPTRSGDNRDREIEPAIAGEFAILDRKVGFKRLLSGDLLPNLGLAGKRSVHRTTFCDPGQALALLPGEIALEGDLLFDNVNLSIVLALAIFAILCVNLMDAQIHIYRFQRYVFAFRIQSDGHRLARCQ